MSNEGNIALVVIDAISHQADEEKGVVVQSIAELVNKCDAKQVYEFSVENSGIRHSGKVIKRGYGEMINASEAVSQTVPGQVVLAGGELGYVHYQVFMQYLAKMVAAGANSVIYIPLNATYTCIGNYDSGENWTSGKAGERSDHELLKYTSAVMRHAGAAALVADAMSESLTGASCPSGALVQVRIYDRWQDMPVLKK